MNEIRVMPAYGRDYTEIKNILSDWEANRDFRMIPPTGYAYINKADYFKYGNKLDSVIYDYKGIFVMLEFGIL
jgi:hypothetical protein